MVDTRQATVVGIFANRPGADEAITALQNVGFQNSQIRQYVGKSRSGSLTGIKNALSAEQKTPEAVVNDLLDMGVAPEHTNFYQREYEAGHPLVAVTSSKRLQEASAILQKHGGYGPHEEKKSDAYVTGGAGGAGGASIAQRETARTASGDNSETEQRGRGARREEDLRGRGELQEQHMRLHAEHLRASKQPAQLGEVILRKELVSEQETLDVPIVHEEVVIERRTLAEDALAANERMADGQVIRIPVSGEQVNLTKEIVTTGEVVVGKREVQETRHFSETCQHEEARLEHQGDIPIWDKNADQSPPQSRL
ncbi:MAG TPA: YsnF/AvaK domain-containing protein [Ktedonobacteraceae bacterium]|nr:YsnF/AvaK domain-containing protein [Ktedonobacteraceae bacterium]